MQTTISTKGQIILPAEIRRMDGLKAGQALEIERLDCGDYRLRRVAAVPNEGLVNWLLSCPVKGFLKDSSSTATTDDILPDFR